MRRWATAAAGLLACAVLAGCTLPEDVDGDLTNSWGPMPSAGPFRPDAGTCHREMTQTSNAGRYDPIPCAGQHLAETVAVADLTADTEAFRECSRLATAYLGADWRTGWLVLQPVRPSTKAWDAGAHWARCDVAETSPLTNAVVARSGSLKGALQAAAGNLLMACANPTIEGEKVTAMRPVACAGNHTAEFAGVFEAAARSTPTGLKTEDLADGCERAIAKFAKLKDDGNLASRVGWLGFPPDATAWGWGDRAIRCFLWLNGDKMKGSYRNAGPGKLPIRYG
jgi:putative regulator of septum formation